MTRALMPYRHLTHVLLVEDDAGYTALVQAVLEAEWPDQLRLTVCATVGQAETRLAQSEAEIDCVVLDLRLPDSDGLDALHRLVSVAPEIPIVILSGVGDEGVAVDAVREGAQDFLIKTHADGLSISRAIRYAIERKRTQLALAQRGLHDPLTSVPNRLLLENRLGLALDRARRRESKVAVLFLDLDGFKSVNDSYGHELGDQVLVEVARRLSRLLRPTDTVARFGGDEFVILCEDIGDVDEVLHIAQRAGEAIAAPVALEGRELQLTPSIGIAVSSGDPSRYEDLLREADAAMYRAKQGAGGCEVYDEEMQELGRRQLDMERDLQGALDADELILHYQPQVDLSTGRVVGLEALIRWAHPRRGLLAAAEFIPVAERSDLIVRLGDWTIERLGRQGRAWDIAGRARTPRLSINVSARQLAHRGLPASLAHGARCAGVSPGLLTTELTEASILRAEGRRASAAQRLRGLSSRVSLADFGSGYASLSMLTGLPLGEVKVNQGLVRDMHGGGHQASVARAVAQFAGSLGLDAVAEGIETEAHLRRLSGLGV